MAQAFWKLGVSLLVALLMATNPPAPKKMKIDASMVGSAGSMSGLLKMLGEFKEKGLLRDGIGEVPTIRDVQNVAREYGETDTPYGKLAARPEIYPIYACRECPMLFNYMRPLYFPRYSHIRSIYIYATSGCVSVDSRSLGRSRTSTSPKPACSPISTHARGYILSPLSAHSSVTLCGMLQPEGRSG